MKKQVRSLARSKKASSKSKGTFSLCRRAAKNGASRVTSPRVASRPETVETELARQYEAQLEVLNAVTRGLASKFDFQGVIDLVGDKIQEIFDAQVVIIALYDPQTKLMRFPYGFGPLDGKVQRLYADPRPPAGFSGRVLKTGQPLIMNTKMEAYRAEFGSTLLGGTRYPKSAIVMPILSGDKTIGTISLQNFDRENAFPESDARLLTTLAANLGIAIQNAQSFDQVQSRNREITEALAQQTATSEVLRALSSSATDLRQLLGIIAVNAAKVCGADDAHIYRIEGETLKEWTHRGPIPGLEAGESLPLNRGSVIGRAILNRETIHIRDAAVDLDEAEYPVSVALQRRWGYRTALAIPLLRDGEPIGGIAIRRLEVRPFTDKQILLLRTFADQAVIAVENARLFDETQRLLKETEQRAAELQIINSVQEGLASKLEMQAIYDLIGDKIRDLFDAQIVTIANYDLEKEMYYTRYGIEKGQRFYPEPRRFGYTANQLIRTRQPVLHRTEEERNASGVRVFPGTDPPKSAAYVPLIMGDAVRGVISLQNVDHEYAFSEPDVRLLQTLANSMTVALENARLFDETNRLLQQTEQRAAELAIINSVEQGLASKLDIQGIYDLVGDKMREIFDAQTMYIAIIDPATGLAHFRYMVSFGKRFYDEPPTKPTGFGGRVLENRSPLLLNHVDLALMREYGSYLQGLEDEEKVSHSWMGAPIVVGDQAIGVISIQNQREDAFTEQDLRLLTTLASSMSVALENARLFDETQRLFQAEQQRAAELAIINTVQQGLASKLDIQGIYDLVGDKIREIFDAQAVMITEYDLAKGITHIRYMVEKEERYQPQSGPMGDFGKYMIRAHQPVLINENWEERMADLGIAPRIIPGSEIPRSSLHVPLIVANEVKGSVSLQNIDHENAFSDSDVRLLSTLANSMSVALEEKRLRDQEQAMLKALERELEIGREIQSGFLPDELPQPSGWEIAARFQPAREVAGDFYDAFTVGEGKIALVVADVCDKGVGAALFMALARSLLRALAQQNFATKGSDAAHLKSTVTQTNDYIAVTHDSSNMFATLFIGVLDPKSGALTYINAGHNPPIVIGKRGVKAQMGRTGPAVGVIPQMKFDTLETRLDPDDTLLAYTDGVTDAENPNRKEFSIERLQELAQTPRSSADELLDAIHSELRAHIADAPQADDITLLAARRT